MPLRRRHEPCCPAAALICLATWRGAGYESPCVAEVKRLRQGAVPDVGLVGFADELLCRNGDLVRAASDGRLNRNKKETTQRSSPHSNFFSSFSASKQRNVIY